MTKLITIPKFARPRAWHTGCVFSLSRVGTSLPFRSAAVDRLICAAVDQWLADSGYGPSAEKSSIQDRDVAVIRDAVNPVALPVTEQTLQMRGSSKHDSFTGSTSQFGANDDASFNRQDRT